MEQKNEKLLRAETVSCLVALSKAYAGTPGHRPLKHWTRLQAALEASLTGVASMGQWQEAVRSHLHIAAPSSLLCSALESLDRAVEDAGADFFDWLYLVRREVVWFIVQVRLESEKRAEARAERQSTGFLESVIGQPEPSPATDSPAPTRGKKGRK
jgi:hypothetical protein